MPPKAPSWLDSEPVEDTASSGTAEGTDGGQFLAGWCQSVGSIFQSKG